MRVDNEYERGGVAYEDEDGWSRGGRAVAKLS